MGNDENQATGIIIDGIGVVKLDTKPHPRIVDIEALVRWAQDKNVMLPPLTINPTTLSSWFQEENKLNMPIPPEEILPVFWKTTAKVTKRG